MRFLNLFVIGVSLLVNTTAHGQAAATTGRVEKPASGTVKTPRECFSTVDAALAKDRIAFIEHAKSERMDVKRKEAGLADVSSRRTAALARCAMQFSVASIDPKELVTLAFLYKAANQDEKMIAAIERNIDVSVVPSQKAVALGSAITVLTSSGEETPVSYLSKAEQYMLRLDALGGEALKERVEAHATLASTYKPDDARAAAGSDLALSLARSVPVAQRGKMRQALRTAYGLAAKRLAEQWQFDKAAALLKELTNFASPPGVVSVGSADNLDAERYAMVGKPAPSIPADFWINASADSGKAVDFSKHKLTLIEFTTTWCYYCKKGYPTIIRLAQRYKHVGFQPVFVTSIQGFTDDDATAATREEELAYDEEHWIKGEGITFPIYVLDTSVEPITKSDGTQILDDDSMPRTRRTLPRTWELYHVAGYPTYFFVDQDGIVRYVQVGHSTDLEQRFSQVIEHLVGKDGARAGANI